MLRRKRNSLTSGNCTLRDEKEPMVFWAKRWTSANCTLRDEKEATSMVRLLGEEMVCLCCVGRGTA
jgi:hypothetical protein